MTTFLSNIIYYVLLHPALVIFDFFNGSRPSHVVYAGFVWIAFLVAAMTSIYWIASV